MIYRVQDTNLDWIYQNGIQRGVDVGFHSLEDMFSIKKGYPLFVMEAPAAGKSEFTLEILINLSKFYGWKHFIFSPETGTPKEIYAELAAKYIGQDYMNTYGRQMDYNDKMKAEQWLEEHFVIVDAGYKVNLESFYDLVDSTEYDLGIKFDTVLLDPWNKIKHEKKGRRDDEYLEEALNDIILNAKEKNRVNIVTTHCREHSYNPLSGPTVEQNQRRAILLSTTNGKRLRRGASMVQNGFYDVSLVATTKRNVR